jgi:PadR family transcriptional regulator PadR
MPDSPSLSYTSALILGTINAGAAYGFQIMDLTGLPSGTVYPALRRLERDHLVKSAWEKEKTAFAEQRPARKYYRLTRPGEQALDLATQRYRLPEFQTPEKL